MAVVLSERKHYKRPATGYSRRPPLAIRAGWLAGSQRVADTKQPNCMAESYIHYIYNVHSATDDNNKSSTNN